MSTPSNRSEKFEEEDQPKEMEVVHAGGLKFIFRLKASSSRQVEEETLEEADSSEAEETSESSSSEDIEASSSYEDSSEEGEEALEEEEDEVGGPMGRFQYLFDMNAQELERHLSKFPSVNAEPHLRLNVCGYEAHKQIFEDSNPDFDIFVQEAMGSFAEGKGTERMIIEFIITKYAFSISNKKAVYLISAAMQKLCRVGYLRGTFEENEMGMFYLTRVHGCEATDST